MGITTGAHFQSVSTARLLLRRVLPADLEAVLAIQTDPQTNLYNPAPFTDDQTRRLMDQWQQDWAQHGFGYWAVSRIDVPERVIGIGGVRRAAWSDAVGLNLYFRFRPEAWGQGLAIEMAQTAVALARQHLPQEPIYGIARASNLSSRRVLERLGMRLIEENRPERDGGGPSVRYVLRPGSA
jgi:RimJ/RimL family protein N-acetyltransferase